MPSKMAFSDSLVEGCPRIGRSRSIGLVPVRYAHEGLQGRMTSVTSFRIASWLMRFKKWE